MNWIAVKERLPQTNTPIKVVGLVNTQIPYVLDFLPEGRFILHILFPEQVSEDVTTVVTHWLPLPELPIISVPGQEDKEIDLEVIADSILPRFVPDDPNATNLSFEINAEGQKYMVEYGKDKEGYWKFKSATKVE